MVALTADVNDLTLKDIAELSDVFWIGGTKVGAFFGEAIVFPNAELAIDFDFHIKQRNDYQHSVVRLVTSWVSNESEVEAFIRVVSE